MNTTSMQPVRARRSTTLDVERWRRARFLQQQGLSLLKIGLELDPPCAAAVVFKGLKRLERWENTPRTGEISCWMRWQEIAVRGLPDAEITVLLDHPEESEPWGGWWTGEHWVGLDGHPCREPSHWAEWPRGVR